MEGLPLQSRQLCSWAWLFGHFAVKLATVSSTRNPVSGFFFGLGFVVLELAGFIGFF
jgi:hypothetical protein